MTTGATEGEGMTAGEILLMIVGLCLGLGGNLDFILKKRKTFVDVLLLLLFMHSISFGLIGCMWLIAAPRSRVCFGICEDSSPAVEMEEQAKGTGKLSGVIPGQGGKACPLKQSTDALVMNNA